MHTPRDSALGKDVAYPTRYDPTLLFPIARSLGRNALGIDRALPFIGHDRWQAYELAWLDARGKPQVATATLHVPADSPNLVESKSLKLYLNSLNAHRFDTRDALQRTVVDDVSAAAGAPVAMAFGLPAMTSDTGQPIDDIDVVIETYGPPDARLLHADAAQIVEETLSSQLLKSNCPVTGQPDWASITIDYRGPRIDHASLLRYLVSFRDHSGFHEQCVERIFEDVRTRCAVHSLSVEARYTRRGGLDINPWRATPDRDAPAEARDLRQ